MTKICLHIICFFTVFISFIACENAHSGSVKPNVIIVLTDDQGWGDVGYNGNEIIETPCLDSLADNAVVLNRFYVSPVCAPTRASLLTGKYNLSTGATWVTHRKEVMRESEVTIAEILKDNGYNTACFGKWHNGQQYPHNPNGQGFDIFFGFSAGHWNNYFDTELEFNGKMVETKGYITDVITDSVESFIRNTNEPFFAYVAYNTPHTPYQVANNYYEKYQAKQLDCKTAAIYGMCENIDDNVARIQKVLKEQNKHENTIFIYLSDNGPNYVRYNGGYKGRKAMLDEGAIRVPFIIDYPAGDFCERVVKQQYAAHIDLLPTILELCNIAYNTASIDGRSFVKLLSDSTTVLADRKFFTHQVFDSTNFGSAIRTNDYLLACYPGDTALFNLSDDPFQMHNLLQKESALAINLKGELNNWLERNNHNKVIPEPIQIGHENVTSIEFPAHECSLLQNVNFAGGMGWANDYIINWDNNNDQIKWPVSIIKNGSYKATLHYVCNKQSEGAQFTLRCNNNSVDFNISKAHKKRFIQSPDRIKRVEAYEVNWGQQNIGIINLEQGNTTLDLLFNENMGSSIEIKGILLEPVNILGKHKN